MTGEDFDFDKTHRRFPDHWDEEGRPTVGSAWHSRVHPHMRVRIIDRATTLDDVDALVYWDGDLDGLKLVFTDDSGERWNVAENDQIYGSAGIMRASAEDWPQRGEDHHRWRDETAALVVTFAGGSSGGPTRGTWGVRRESAVLRADLRSRPHADPLGGPQGTGGAAAERLERRALWRLMSSAPERPTGPRSPSVLESASGSGSP